MSTDAFENEVSIPGVAPSVSREKWARHALNKMAHGYVLIVGSERRNANFFKAGKGFEMCSYLTAKQLIRQGMVVEGGPHPLGTMYFLAPTALIQPLPKPEINEDDEDAASPIDDELRIVLGNKVVPVTDVEDLLADAEDDDQDVDDAAEADDAGDEDDTSFLFGEDTDLTSSKRIRGGF